MMTHTFRSSVEPVCCWSVPSMPHADTNRQTFKGLTWHPTLKRSLRRLLFFVASDKISTTQHHKNNQDGPLTESVNITVEDWDPTMDPSVSRHRRTNLRQAVIVYFFCTRQSNPFVLTLLNRCTSVEKTD